MTGVRGVPIWSDVAVFLVGDEDSLRDLDWAGATATSSSSSPPISIPALEMRAVITLLQLVYVSFLSVYVVLTTSSHYLCLLTIC